MNLCSDCGYSAKTKQAFNDHFAKHENEKVVCDLCGKTFDTPGRLRSHKLVYHGDKDYSCDKCEKTFSKKDHLRRHTKNPNCSKAKNCKKKSCKFCKVQFSSTCNLKKHMRAWSK